MTYLEQLKKSLKAPSGEPTKPTKRGFDGFVGTPGGPFQKKTERSSRAEVLQALARMEPCSEEEAAFVRRLEADGWSRRELVSLLNEDTAARSWERSSAEVEPLGPDPERWPADLRYRLAELEQLGMRRGEAVAKILSEREAGE